MTAQSRGGKCRIGLSKGRVRKTDSGIASGYPNLIGWSEGFLLAD